MVGARDECGERQSKAWQNKLDEGRICLQWGDLGLIPGL